MPLDIDDILLTKSVKIGLDLTICLQTCQNKYIMLKRLVWWDTHYDFPKWYIVGVEELPLLCYLFKE